MNNQEIVDNAPEIKNNAGAMLYYSPESDRYYEEHDGYWYEVDDYTMTKIVAPTAFIRSLSDIKRIVELEHEVQVKHAKLHEALKLRDTSNGRAAEFEKALTLTNNELSVSIDEINSKLTINTCSTDLDDPSYWDKETCHNNVILLKELKP
jgi:hypothetical protein